MFSNDIAKPFWANGPAPGQFYNFVGNNLFANEIQNSGPAGIFGTQRTSSPITTGTSVVGIKFDEGVIIAADNLVSYGSLARFQDVERVFKINEKIAIGTGGDFADFQSLKRIIDQKMCEDICYNDTIEMKPKSMYNWLTRVLYNKRSKFDPLWLDMVVGGMEDGVPFLGHVDLRGRSYVDTVVATGFGKHLALPIVRERISDTTKLNRADAEQLMKKCMEVLYYRDCRALSKYSMAIVTKEGTEILTSQKVNENWQLATMVKGY
ncbi:proteasome subunit beta type-4 [Eupeodes corollae]|uniref:proteasome subunit beta type-4 n=1 Tax=Eupeodes corollae TaxID=290404 RepID=UPI0024902AE4|nr:proteasome subunit beta type-4 [Eupeodes corollae]